MYVTPGLGGRKPGDYAYFDCKYSYETLKLQEAANILGYKLCIWADNAELETDKWFDQFADNPKAVPL